MGNEDADVFENFYGVYLLLCENPKFKGRTYIGYTVDPVRRLIRHNAGMEFGGAKRTNNKGPWNMVFVVHGFPNSRSALRFEWAWQHPQLSRHLRHVPKRKTRESVFKYLLSVVSAMLQVPPWCRLPLVIRWLDLNFVKDYSDLVQGPNHMVVKYEKVVAKKIGKGKRKKNSDDKENDHCGLLVCNICSEGVEKEELVNCVEKQCDLIAHMICLAKVFRKDKKILPIDGECPECHQTILWGSVIRKKIGCQV